MFRKTWVHEWNGHGVLGKINSCSSFTLLPGPAMVLFSKIASPLFDIDKKFNFPLLRLQDPVRAGGRVQVPRAVRRPPGLGHVDARRPQEARRPQLPQGPPRGRAGKNQAFSEQNKDSLVNLDVL